MTNPTAESLSTLRKTPAPFTILVIEDDPSDTELMLHAIEQADLVLMGFHRPVFGTAILGGTVHHVLSVVPADAVPPKERNSAAPVTATTAATTHQPLDRMDPPSVTEAG